MRKGKLVFKAMMFNGLIGVYTGIKPGVFTVSQNTRTPKQTVWSLLTSIFDSFMGREKFDLMIRNALENQEAFGNAVTYLQNAKTSSPGYIILGGISGNEGVVLSRSRDGTVEQRWIHE